MLNLARFKDWGGRRLVADHVRRNLSALARDANHYNVRLHMSP
jgi:hypothetical protein